MTTDFSPLPHQIPTWLPQVGKPPKTPPPPPLFISGGGGGGGGKSATPKQAIFPHHQK